MFAAEGERPQNLIKNPRFEGEIQRPWSLVKGVVRKETAALSGVWMLSALGKNYFIVNYMDDPDLKWEAGEEFTIALDVRSRGAGSTLMVIHRYTAANGGVGEGWATRIQPTAEWHEYIIPFRATSGGQPRGFSFFKIDNGAHDTGIEIRSFKMYRGRISALDFVPVGRNARAGVLEGAAIPMKQNLFGVAAKPLKVLAVVPSLTSVREAKHVFAGTGAEAHVIVAEGKGANSFTTDDDSKRIRHLLMTGGYDLYAFGRRSAAAIGEELFAIIETNVLNGASAFFAPTRDGQAGLFNKMHSSAASGRYGRGRVTAAKWRRDVDGVAGGSDLSFIDNSPLADEYAIASFPYEEIEFARTADRLWKAAFGAPDVSAAKKVTEENIYRGKVHGVERYLDSSGRTLAFSCRESPVSGASLGEMVDGGREVVIPVSNGTESAMLKWRFSDFSGRIFGEGSQRGSSRVTIAVPREKLYTGLGVLETELVDGGKMADRRNFMVIEPSNDRKRMIGDYGVGFWSVSSAYARMDRRDMVRALGELGFRYAFCHGGWGDMYTSGMAATLSYVIGGEYFSGGPTSVNNVRRPVFNTKEARGRIREMATRWAKENRRHGGMYGSFSDEARLGPNGEEVDAHPENIETYRLWMERKYGTIEEYNRRHLTSHRSFADLGQTLLKDARAAGNAAEFILDVNAAIHAGVRSASPDAHVIFYDTAWPDDAVRTVVPHLPKDGRLVLWSEKLLPFRQAGMDLLVNEYSISHPGPAPRALPLWAAARAAGLKADAKLQVNTSWEICATPYLPTVDLVAEHIGNLAENGIDGLMLSWSLGGFPSPNLALVERFRRNANDIDAILDGLAADLYGVSSVQPVRMAWKRYSDAFRNYPLQWQTVYYSPVQLGPANLLYPKKTGWNATMVNTAYDDLKRWTDGYAANRGAWLDLMQSVADGFDEGDRLWRDAVAGMSGAAKEVALREQSFFRAATLHFRSAADQARFIQARDGGDAVRMREIAARELSTAKEMLGLVLRESAIGYESSNRYMYVPNDMREKILVCRKLLDP